MGVAQRFGAAVDVFLRGAGEAGDRGVFHPPRHFADAFEIADAGDREAGFDNVDAQMIEQIGDFELLLEGHRGARRLLAVAQGRVENQNALAGLRVRGRVFVHIEFPKSAAPRRDLSSPAFNP